MRLLQAEEAVKAHQLPLTSIFRPGLLDRGVLGRPVENLMGMMLTKIKVGLQSPARSAIKLHLFKYDSTYITTLHFIVQHFPLH